MAIRPSAPEKPAEISLDALVGDPATVARLSAGELEFAAVQVAGLLERLHLQALALRSTDAPAPAEPPGQTLTATEVAARLRVPRPYVYELIRRGELPVVTVGPKYVRVPTQALAAWVTRQTRIGVDTGMYRRYSSDRDRRRATTTPTQGQPDAGPGGRAARRD